MAAAQRQRGAAFACLGVVLPGLLLQDAWRYSFFAAGVGRKAFVNDVVWGVALIPAMVVAAQAGTVPAFVLAWGGSAAVAAAYGWAQSGIRPRLTGARPWIRDHRDLGYRYLVENTCVSGAASCARTGSAPSSASARSASSGAPNCSKARSWPC